MAERILLNEFKALAQEKWVNIEVGSPRSLNQLPLTRELAN